MFTGIIQAVGRIAAREPRGGDLRLRVATGKLPLDGVALGDSIATNGVCLTAVELPGDGFWADVSVETLRLTTLESIAVGDPVNLELALTPTSRLGGHIVSGHVDGLGTVVSLEEAARSIAVTIDAPPALARYIAVKGSICVDGTSLTINAVDGNRFSLNIVPHTMQETIFGHYRPGTRVNLEVDVVARYLERLLLGEQAAASAHGQITAGLLAEHGYLKGGQGHG